MTTATALGVTAASRFGDVGNAVYTAAQWLEYCNEAYNKINAFTPLWPWLETTEQTITFTPNANPATARTQPLPTDVVGVNWVYDTTDDYRLIDQMGRGDFFHQDHLRSEVGQVVTYRVRGASIEVAPAPSAVTVCVAECILLPAALAGGSSPVFPSAFHDTLIEGMLAAAYLDDGNVPQNEKYEGRFQMQLAAMRNSILMSRTESNQPIRDTFWS